MHTKINPAIRGMLFKEHFFVFKIRGITCVNEFIECAHYFKILLGGKRIFYKKQQFTLFPTSTNFSVIVVICICSHTLSPNCMEYAIVLFALWFSFVSRSQSIHSLLYLQYTDCEIIFVSFSVSFKNKFNRCGCAAYVLRENLKLLLLKNSLKILIQIKVFLKK